MTNVIISNPRDLFQGTRDSLRTLHRQRKKIYPPKTGSDAFEERASSLWEPLAPLVDEDRVPRQNQPLHRPGHGDVQHPRVLVPGFVRLRIPPRVDTFDALGDDDVLELESLRLVDGRNDDPLVARHKIRLPEVTILWNVLFKQRFQRRCSAVFLHVPPQLGDVPQIFPVQLITGSLPGEGEKVDDEIGQRCRFVEPSQAGDPKTGEFFPELPEPRVVVAALGGGSGCAY